MTDQSERRLGIGVIGCGNVAHFAHLPNIARNPRARLVAVADIDAEKAQKTSEQYGGAVYTDHQELLANPDVEMVCVTTWPLAHARAVIDAAQAGKHILCEKPIATTLADADAMVAAAEQANVKFTMGYQTRFGVAWPLIKQVIDDGLLGRIMGVNIAGVAPSGLYAPWFLKKELSGGGVLMDWGIYTAFAINWWLGPVERVYATSAIFRPELIVKDQLITDLDVEDTIVAVRHELAVEWGFDVRVVAPDALTDAGDVDFFVATSFCAPIVHDEVEELGKPLIVLTIHSALQQAISSCLREGRLTVVAVDARFGERMRVAYAATNADRDNFRVVLTDDRDAIARLDPDEPVLLTRAARQRLPALRVPMIYPHSPTLSMETARALASIVVRKNLDTNS